LQAATLGVLQHTNAATNQAQRPLTAEQAGMQISNEMRAENEKRMPKPAPPATQQQPTPAPAFTEEDVNAMVAKLPQNNNISPEQHKQFATKTLTWMKQPENQALLQGAQEYKDGNTNTPGAKQFAAALDKRRATFIEEQMAKATAADPTAASTPQGWGGMLQQATAAWEQMPTEMKWVMGLGLGGGLLGMAASIFGEGGMGMGLLGMLGLGAAGMAGATHGMFGQDAQNMVNDGLIGLGQLTGHVPGKTDLSVLLAKDPVAALRAEHGQIGTREEMKQKLDAARAKAEQLKQFVSMPMPESTKLRMLQKIDPNIKTPEDAQRAMANANILLKAYADPNSDLSRMVNKAQTYADSKGVLGWGAENLLAPAANYWHNLWPKKAHLVMPEGYTIAHRMEAEFRGMKLARCWAGYEPVPGTKKYSEGSCRPKGSKKTQKEMKSGKERHADKS
jgi:hypothetical protein